MATFPEPYIPDVMQGIRAHQSGYAFGRERRQNALASRAGGLAASGDIGGAANALLEGGDIQGGFAIQDRIRAMAKDADEQQLLKSQRANDAFFRLATVADTPQKWQMAIGQLRQMGVDTAGFDDFGSREMAMARFGQTKDVLGTMLEERKARAIGQALLPQQADPAQADRRPTVGNAMQGWKGAIAGIESAHEKNPYTALGPVVRSGDRAYGKYQVMGANVGPWTREILGQELTPQQFLASPEAQERVFEGKFSQYVQKTGDPSAAASMWFTGRPSAPNAQARNPDGSPLGITGQQYVNQFRAGLGQQNALAPQPAGGLDYEAGIRAAIQQGDLNTAKALLDMARGGADKSRYTASRQGVLDTWTGNIQPLPAGAEGSAAEYGTSPQYIRDPKTGKVRIGQLSKAGGIKLVDVEGDVLPGLDFKDVGTGYIPFEKRTGQQAGPMIPKDLAGAEAQKKVGEATGQAIVDLPKVRGSTAVVVGMIENVQNDPYLASMTGPVQGRLPNLSGSAARVQSKVAQLQGTAFLQAFQEIKGGGAITEVEGAKAEAAKSRLLALNVNDVDYPVALKDFKDEVLRLAQLAEAKARGPGSSAASGQQGGGDPLAQARDAIARGAPRDAVIRRLQENGIDPSGL